MKGRTNLGKYCHILGENRTSVRRIENYHGERFDHFKIAVQNALFSVSNKMSYCLIILLMS